MSDKGIVPGAFKLAPPTAGPRLNATKRRIAEITAEIERWNSTEMYETDRAEKVTPLLRERSRLQRREG